MKNNIFNKNFTMKLQISRLLFFLYYAIFINSPVLCTDNLGEDLSVNTDTFSIVRPYQPDELLIEKLEDREYTAHTTQALKAERVLEDFIIPQGLCILDVGCGNGEVTFKIASITNASKIVGIDPNKDKIMSAKKTYADTLKLEFYEKSIEDLSEEGVYDVSTCFATLHWISEENQKVAFQNISKSLKLGGIFIATFMTESNKIRLNTAVQKVRIQEKWQKNFREYTDPIYMANPSFIRNLLTSCGFKIRNFEHDQTTREFKSNNEFHEWINKWSTYGKYFEEKSQHDEFWWDVIHLYRELTNQTTEDILFLTEYNLRLYTTKL